MVRWRDVIPVFKHVMSAMNTIYLLVMNANKDLGITEKLIEELFYYRLSTVW